MPIYEYGCKACEHEFETIQKLSEAPLVDCPACGEATLRKKVSAAAFRLKGGGWYETDFKSGGKKNLHGEQAATDGDKGAKGEAGKDADKSAGGGDAAKGDAKPTAANGKSAKTEAATPAKSAASAD